VQGPPGDGTYWRRWFLLFWAGIALYMLWYKWNAIHWFALGDTDDNMRFAQVRALLQGQPWFDLRQYRMDPPAGISIHWSRLVDLPIAALMLLIKPFAGGQEAARWACAIAPMLAFGAGLYGMMLTVRRLVDKWAFMLAVPILLCANGTMLMWMPLRIDHHGWQLASLIVTVAGMADEKRLRGGLTAGLATAFSLAIGLELLPYLAVTGALIVLWWAIDGDQADRLRGYGASLAAGTAIGYAGFGSFDNAQPLCDALTPVYLSTLLFTGGLLVALGSLPLKARWMRIAAAVAAAAAICGGHALAWPQCLGRPERISPELDTLWFSHIREAKPLYQHGWRIATPIMALSLIGLVGAVITLWRERKGPRAMPWLLVTLLSLFSALLLLWQTRAGPASQLLGVIGATGLGWQMLRWTLADRRMMVRVFGSVAAFILVSGGFAAMLVNNVPQKVTPFRQQVDYANRRCPTLPSLKPIAALKPQIVLTFVDLGPRLIAVTDHSAIAGPYHRAGNDILDVQHSFRANDPEVAHEVMRRHGATLLLICPNTSEATVYYSESPVGFYVQLWRGKVPDWLAPVPLPANSPYKLWRRLN
jgi:hypothetical protein